MLYTNLFWLAEKLPGNKVDNSKKIGFQFKGEKLFGIKRMIKEVEVEVSVKNC